MSLFARMLAICIGVVLVGSAVAGTPPPPRRLHVFYVPGIFKWTDADQKASKDALQAAIEASPQWKDGSPYRTQYPIVLYDFVDNQFDELVALTMSKTAEELYVRPLQAALMEGGPFAPVRDLVELGNMYGNSILSESAEFQKVIQAGLFTVGDALHNNEDVVLVAHSHGNVIANYIYSGIAHDQSLGWPALDHLRIVSVGTVALFSPNNLVVNASSDNQVYTAMPTLGWTIDRMTPFCHGRCAFSAMPATVDSSCVAGEITCHGFVGAYLSTNYKYDGVGIRGQRAETTADLHTDRTMQSMVVDTFFTALDQMQGSSYKWVDWGVSKPYWSQPAGAVTSKKGILFELNASNAGTNISSSLWYKGEFTYGGIVTTRACISPSPSNGSILALEEGSFHGLANFGDIFSTEPPIGAVVNASLYNSALVLMDGSATKHPIPSAPLTNGRYCGVFSFGVCPDRSGVVQFINETGGQITTHHSAVPIASVVRRLTAAQFGNEVLTIKTMDHKPLLFNTKYVKATNAVCKSPETPS